MKQLIWKVTKGIGAAIGVVGSTVTIVALFTPDSDSAPQNVVVKEIYYSQEGGELDLYIYHVDFDVALDDTQNGLLVAIGSYVNLNVNFRNKSDVNLSECILKYQYKFNEDSDKYYNNTRAIPSLVLGYTKNWDNYAYRSQRHYEDMMPEEAFYFSIPANNESEMLFVSSGIFSEPSAARVRIRCAERISNWYYLSDDRISYSEDALSFEVGGPVYRVSAVLYGIISMFD